MIRQDPSGPAHPGTPFGLPWPGVVLAGAAALTLSVFTFPRLGRWLFLWCAFNSIHSGLLASFVWGIERTGSSPAAQPVLSFVRRGGLLGLAWLLLTTTSLALLLLLHAGLGGVQPPGSRLNLILTAVLYANALLPLTSAGLLLGMSLAALPPRSLLATLAKGTAAASLAVSLLAAAQGGA